MKATGRCTMTITSTARRVGNRPENELMVLTGMLYGGMS